jgi:NDP-sugar pyrophosphorylase family protein
VTPDVVVMAAGEGRRLRPLTEHWPKAILPIDGRPVVATLLRDLREAGATRVWLVTGYLRDRVEALVGDGAAFGLDVRNVHQPSVLGSSDAVARALEAGASPPLVVCAADTVFRRGDVAYFIEKFVAVGAAGAIAVRSDPPPGPDRPAVEIADGFVHGISRGDRTGSFSGAPLWGVGPAVVAQLRCDEAPFELENSFRAALAAGERIAAVEIGKTRDLTDPLDLVEENFPYLAQ